MDAHTRTAGDSHDSIDRRASHATWARTKYYFSLFEPREGKGGLYAPATCLFGLVFLSDEKKGALLVGAIRCLILTLGLTAPNQIGTVEHEIKYTMWSRGWEARWSMWEVKLDRMISCGVYH